MVVDDFNLNWISIVPSETDSILIVDSNRVLPYSITAKFLEPIARRDAKLIEPLDCGKLKELSPGNVDEARRANLTGSLRGNAVVDMLGARVRKRHDNEYSV
jgi:hypothetical protein